MTLADFRKVVPARLRFQPTLTSMVDVRLRDLWRDHFDWDGWERLLAERGVTVDRPYGARHPRFDEIVYPIDYGYIEGTVGTDDEAVDVFAGSAGGGLVGVALTTDHRRGDREAKLLYRCSPEEVYLVHGFLNFDPALMESLLVLRRPMAVLWGRSKVDGRSAKGR